MVTFDNKEYQSLLTAPSIPYAIYIHEDHLLLVPREVNKKHPKFPTNSDQNKRYTLRLSDDWCRAYTEFHKKPPKFLAQDVAFGLKEDSGVVVAALLSGSELTLCWDFNSILASTETEIKKHFSIDDDLNKLWMDLCMDAPIQLGNQDAGYSVP